MNTLLTVFPLWTRILTVLVLIGAVFGIGYFKGWSGEHDKLIAFQAEVKAVGIAAQKHADDVNKANAALTKSLEVSNVELTKTRATAIAAQRAADKLRDDNAASRQLPGTAFAASLSNDSAVNARVSQIVQRFSDGARAALAQCGSAARDFADRGRESAAAADTNTDSLMTLQDLLKGAAK